MADQKKLDRWAEKLLDTGKRNNLINFRDTKASTAEVVFPDCRSIFAKCFLGHTFEIYDPKIEDDEIPAYINDGNKETKLSKEEYVETYSSKVRKDHQLLVYAQTPNPLTAVKNISKRAKSIQDETGLNVTYLAFGFLKWNEKEGSDIYFRAPLVLVHTNIITGSVIDPVKIEISDDDIVVNPTLNYLLQAEYGLSLPAFEDEDTLATYYGKVSKAIEKLGWEVIDECKLGIFSFLKINMYEDLKKNAEQILQNNNVRAILGEPLVGGGMVQTVDEDHVVANPLIDLHTVVEADSSQIKAIEMAKSGKSFVLQGPPGTGKSQTITNIIAECLHDGKTVLFVSEKQAALNVVYNKLKKAGLADFCLELHSHKANKRAVIEELNRTLEVPKSTVSSAAQEEIRQKREAQNTLDRYAESLHKKRKPIDKSLYQLFEAYSAENKYPEPHYTIPSIETKGPEHLFRAVKLLEQYADYTGSVGQDYRKNAWYGFIKPQISYDERNSLKGNLVRLFKGYTDLQATVSKMKVRYGLSDLNYTETVQWRDVLSFLAGSDVIQSPLLSPVRFKEIRAHLSNMKALSAEILPAKEIILKDYHEKVISEIDGAGLKERLVKHFSGLFTRLFGSDYKSLVADMMQYVKGGTKPKYQQLLDLSEELEGLQDATRAFEKEETFVTGSIGECYCGPDTDWDHVFASLDTMQELFGRGIPGLENLADMTSAEYQEKTKWFYEDSQQLADQIQAVSKEKESVGGVFDKRTLDLDYENFTPCVVKLQRCITDFDKLGNWIGFMGLLDELESAELLPYINQIIKEKTAKEDIAGAYRRLFYKHWIECIIFSNPELDSFSRIKQDQAVRRFSEKDALQYEINKSEIKAELSHNRPNLDLVAGGSAVATLRREGQKKRKQMPIRTLLSATGGLVQIIKPCFLMSPLSVSTFLESDSIRFDTVIFDEASQIFPQDAIGAIYRGNQLIVVGDSKQMPPSNFFNSSVEIDDDDEEIGDINDFESILDIAWGVLDYNRLSWHYRSHYEQLIAFSNANFYDNSLVTFPSSSTDHKGIGVDYFYVDGTFDRKSKTNRAEAEFIVDLIYKNIEKYPNRSLGVVAFSVAQQGLIDALLTKRRENDPSYEWFFREENAEPFFVKNLETVQGDERDTIIFSVAYAKDIQGRFIHNFGPLNREGGERRLNVATTRAKDNVQLVASIHYTDIDLNKSGAEGVRLLRAYLDYAQNGEKALGRALTVAASDQYDSYFEEEVCEYLRSQGFTVDTQIGCSGYRIDLGLRKPDSSNYLLAIECDGATYHNSKNARDRDNLRQTVLENMGWQFYRIWSTDWYKNKQVEKGRLLGVCREALRKVETPAKPDLDDNRPDIGVRASAKANPFEKEIPDINSVFRKYKCIDALRMVRMYSNDFQGAIYRILEAEAPLSEEFLLKRIAPYFGREKVTKVVLQEYARKMYRCEKRGINRWKGFLTIANKNNYELRVPGERREIKYIATEELAAGMYELIKQNVTVTKEGLYKMMTNLLGFSRTGEAILAKYDESLASLERNGLIVLHEDSISQINKGK